MISCEIFNFLPQDDNAAAPAAVLAGASGAASNAATPTATPADSPPASPGDPFELAYSATSAVLDAAPTAAPATASVVASLVALAAVSAGASDDPAHSAVPSSLDAATHSAAATLATIGTAGVVAAEPGTVGNADVVHPHDKMPSVVDDVRSPPESDHGAAAAAVALLDGPGAPTALQELVTRHLGKRQLAQVPKDGDCLFHAIAAGAALPNSRMLRAMVMALVRLVPDAVLPGLAVSMRHAVGDLESMMWLLLDNASQPLVFSGVAAVLLKQPMRILDVRNPEEVTAYDAADLGRIGAWRGADQLNAKIITLVYTHDHVDVALLTDAPPQGKPLPTVAAFLKSWMPKDRPPQDVVGKYHVLKQEQSAAQVKVCCKTAGLISSLRNTFVYL